MSDESTEENRSRQEEARRILDAIRQKESQGEENKTNAEKVIPRLAGQDAVELEALINNTILAKAPPPEEEKAVDEFEPPEISPISTEQIRAIRKFASDKAEVKEPLRKRLAEAVIRSWFELIAYFTPSSKVQRCQREGHVCMHCGVKIPLAVPIHQDEEESAESANPTPKKRT